MLMKQAYGNKFSQMQHSKNNSYNNSVTQVEELGSWKESKIKWDT